MEKGVVVGMVSEGRIVIIDTCTMSKKPVQKREFHDGDIVEFDFEPNSIDIRWQTVTLIGSISGVIYDKDGIFYKVQLDDKKRNIIGYMIVPEGKINGTMKDSIMTIECDFCSIRTHIDQNNLDDVERKTRNWKKLYCLGKKHHILHMCGRCIDMFEKTEVKCPIDQCDLVSKR